MLCHEPNMASFYDFLTSRRHDANCRKCVSSTWSAERVLCFFSVLWVDKYNTMKSILVTFTVDLAGQYRLTTTLTISISVIRDARMMICFVSHVFGVDEFNEIKISFVTSRAPLTLLVKVAWPPYWPAMSTVHVTNLILISLNSFTKKNVRDKKIISFFY